MKERNEKSLSKMFKYATKILEYTKGYSFDDFISDTRTQ